MPQLWVLQAGRRGRGQGEREQGAPLPLCRRAHRQPAIYHPGAALAGVPPLAVGGGVLPPPVRGPAALRRPASTKPDHHPGSTLHPRPRPSTHAPRTHAPTPQSQQCGQEDSEGAVEGGALRPAIPAGALCLRRAPQPHALVRRPRPRPRPGGTHVGSPRPPCRAGITSRARAPLAVGAALKASCRLLVLRAGTSSGR